MLFSDRFEVQRSLGQGGIGETFLVADNARDGGLFAMKRVARSAVVEKAESLRREFDLLSRLDHPNIARVLEWGESEDELFFIEEYVGGGDVFGALKGGDYNRILSALVQILRGLHFLHRQQILHGDLKPENILVVEEASLLREDTIKLIDFGMFRHLTGASHAAGGSVHFVAPEILLERPYDHRADLYALGVCLYRMTTGRYPFENHQGRMDLLIKNQIEKVPAEPARLCADLPRGLNDLAMRLLEKQPSKRPESAEMVLGLLNTMEGERFSILLRRERHPKAPHERGKEKAELLRLCAWAKIPISREVLLSLTEIPAEVLDCCLAALESEGSLRRVLWNGAYHFEALAPKEGIGDEEAPVGALLKLADSSYRSGRLREARRVLSSLSGRFVEEKKGIFRDDRVRYYTIASLIELESGELDRARDLCERFLALPNLTDEEQGKILGRLGWIEYRRGRYQEALEIFRQAGTHWERSGKTEGCVTASNFEGMAYQALRRWKEARDAYRRGLALLKESDPLYPILQMNLASAAQEAEEYKAAITAYEEARRTSETTENFQLRTRLMNNQANLYLYLGHLDVAAKNAHASLKLAVENGLTSLEGNNYLLLSVIADKEGRLDNCREMVEKAVVIFQDHGTASERASAALHQAYHLFTAGNDDGTSNRISEIRSLFPKEEAILAHCDLLEGKLAGRQEPPDEEGGAPLLQRAIDYFESKKDDANLWDALFALGRLLRRRDPGEARRLMEKSLGILERLAEKIPEDFRSGFFRDRKRERLQAEIAALEGSPRDAGRQGGETMASIEGYVEIARINRLLASESNLTYLLETILEESLELLQAERGFILLLEGGQFRVRVARNMDRQAIESDEESPARYSTTIARQAAAGGRSILVAEAQHDDRFQEARSVVELGIKAAIAVPLKIGSEVVGVVYADNRFRPGSLDRTRQEMLEHFADQAALAIRNGRQIEEIRAHQKDLEVSKCQIEELNALLRERLNMTSKELEMVQGKYLLQQEGLQLRYAYDQIIGRSPRLREVLQTLDRVTDSDVTVLILGESGTGKELVARALHFNSVRRGAPFVAENCAAFSENLLESELFGHRKGSFTDAVQDKQGLFEVADGGTVFLDEIGELSPAMQGKLLRVLQERQIRPVGGNDYRKVNVRIVAATNKDLKALVKEGKFREDLYYRINVVKVVLPPLRDRREDIPLLVAHFLKKHQEEGGESVRVQPKAMALMARYDWPGNIRELSNELQKCCAMGLKLITPESLSGKILEEPRSKSRALPLEEQMSNLEKNIIIETLKKHRYSRVKTAKELGFSRITLYKKIKAYGISVRKAD